MKNEITFTDISEVPSSASVRGKLTGIPRRIKDSCADFYNCIQKWNALCIQGTLVLRKIVDCKLQFRNSDKLNDRNEKASEMSQDKRAHILELQDYCTGLETLVEQMEEAVSTMSTIVDRLQSVSELSFQQSSHFDNIPNIAFQTWPVDRFYITTKNILKKYKEELLLKNSILEEIAFLTNQNQMDYFIIAWTHEPYILHKTNELLEALITETGLKLN